MKVTRVKPMLTYGCKHYGVSVLTSYLKLTEVLGEPSIIENIDYDVKSIQWSLLFGDSTIITVYSWNKHPDINENIEWYIGSKTLEESLDFIDDLHNHIS